MRKRRILCLIVVLSVFICALSLSIYVKNYNIHEPNNILSDAPFYPTVHEAMENELKTKIYKAVESNGTCLALCNGHINGYICQYLYKTDAGWQLITKTVCENPVAKGNNEKSQFAVYDYMGKYIVCISQNFLSKESYGKITVTDSLNSAFINLNYKSGSFYDTDYWYICLDALPKDYTIYVNDEPAFKPSKTSLTDKIKNILYQ